MNYTDVPNASFCYSIIGAQYWLYYKVNADIILAEGYKGDGYNKACWMPIYGLDLNRKYKLASMKSVLKHLNKRLFMKCILGVRI